VSGAVPAKWHARCPKLDEVTNVQIAIQDRVYAEKLRDLLFVNSHRSVSLVDFPRLDVAGVVVADETLMERLLQSGEVDFSRYVIFVPQPRFDWDRLFNAGVRHVIHGDSPPEVGRLIVLAVERRLNGVATLERLSAADVIPAPTKPQSGPDDVSMFDSSDRLFLRAQKISPA
jgi:hypothetical protein